MLESIDNFFDDNSLNYRVLEYEKRKRKGKKIYLDVEEYLDIIEYYAEKEKWQKSFEACNSALNIHPQSSELILKNAQLMVVKGKPQLALNCLSKVGELKDSFEYIVTEGLAQINTNQIPKAIKNFNKAIAIADKEDLETLFFSIGDALTYIGKYAIALEYYIQAHKIFPKDSEFIFNIAFCYEKIGNLQKSKKFYQLFLSKNAFSENAWYNLGIIYNQLGNYTEAIEAYEYTIALNPKNYDVLFNLANSLSNAQLFDKAIATYNEYLSVRPDSFTAIYYIGECLYQQKKYNEAKKHFINSIEQFPNFSDFYYGLGLVYFEEKKYKKATKIFLKSIEIDDEHTDSMYALGNVYSQQKKWNNAIEYYKKAIDINKYDVDVILACAYSYYKNKQNNELKDMLIEAKYNMPQEAIILFALAGYLFLLKNNNEAIKWFEKAMKINQNEVDITFEICPKAKRNSEIQNILKNNTI